MNYKRMTPCAHCPFRKDIPGYLRQARAVEIARGLRDPNGGEFPCHETMPRTDSPIKKAKVCAGSILVTERDQGPNQMHRIAERLNVYDPSKLDRDAPCFDDFDEFIAHHGDAGKHVEKFKAKARAKLRRKKKKKR